MLTIWNAIYGKRNTTDEKIKGKFSGKTETNNEYKQGEDTFIDKNTIRTIRARKK